jgi:CarD family transcriptional regulator
MGINVGTKVMYPSQGPCLIGPIVSMDISGSRVNFYRLALLDGSGGELFVPVEKIQSIGLRPLLEKSEIPKLLDQLMTSGLTVKDWKLRMQNNMKLLISSSPFDLAVVVESLTHLNESRSLSFRENRILEKAKKLLVCEVSEVLGGTRIAAEEQINRALGARRAMDSDSLCAE